MKKLGFGFMRLPVINNDYSQIDQDHVFKMVDTFIDRGFCYFDTAYIYHNSISECIIKEALVDRYPRDKFLLADKLPTFLLKSADDMERIFNEQLEKCGVEFFDYYLLHAINADTLDTVNQLNGFDFMVNKKKEGKAKRIGFSYHADAKLLDEILTNHPEMEFVQLQINYLDWDDESIQSRKCYEVAKKHKKDIIVMEPVKGGTLAKLPEPAQKLFMDYNNEMSVASWAIRFAAGFDEVIMVLSGMSNIEQLDDNTGFMQNFIQLNDTEHSIIKKVTKIINSSLLIPCTECRYCVDGCPVGIPIPSYFSLFNTEKRALNKDFSPHQVYFDNIALSNPKPSQCIQCRECEKKCPQHINIVDNLKKIASAFEY